jgi:hypothetical protein
VKVREGTGAHQGVAEHQSPATRTPESSTLTMNDAPAHSMLTANDV